jgi:tetratricopeptide (TPR) repeat protein
MFVHWLCLAAEDLIDIDKPRATQLVYEAADAAKKLNTPSALVKVYFILGKCYSQTEHADSAKFYLQRATDIAHESGLHKWESRAVGQLGVDELINGNYEDALHYMQQAIPPAEKANSIGLIAANYENIAAIFFNLEDYPKALEYDLKAYHYFSINEDIRIIQVISNLGQVYGALANNDSALFYMYMAIEKADYYGDYEMIGYAYACLADQWKEMHRADSALRYYSLALDAYREINYEGSDIGGTLGGFGDVWLEKKEYKKALGYLLQSEEILTAG